MNVLVVAPHPDDESIGCGGAVALHVARGDRVAAVFLTSGELGLKQLAREQAWKVRETEARAASKVLGIATLSFLRCADWMIGDDLPGVAGRLAPILKEQAPALIYLPHPQEWHPDHKAALPAISRALPQSGVALPALRGYEVWTPMAEFQHVEDITPVMPRKLRALRKHLSQVAEWDYVCAIRGLNQFRGVMAGRCRYAEVFQELSVLP